jgi:hypothetical protein
MFGLRPAYILDPAGSFMLRSRGRLLPSIELEWYESGLDGHVGRVFRDGSLALIALEHPGGDSGRRIRSIFSSGPRADGTPPRTHRRLIFGPTEIREFAAKVGSRSPSNFTKGRIFRHR